MLEDKLVVQIKYDGQTFYRTITHCTRHGGPEMDTLETTDGSELRVSVFTTLPLVGGHAVGGSTQVTDAGRR